MLLMLKLSKMKIGTLVKFIEEETRQEMVGIIVSKPYEKSFSFDPKHVSIYIAVDVQCHDKCYQVPISDLKKVT